MILVRLVNLGTSGRQRPGVRCTIKILGTHGLDDQRSPHDNLKVDTGTPGDQIAELKRDLRDLIDQRVAVMSHAQRVHGGVEVTTTHIGTREVGVSH